MSERSLEQAPAVAADTNDLVKLRSSCPGYERHLERNWNGNVTFYGRGSDGRVDSALAATTVAIPESLEELCRIVQDASDATGGLPVRVVGRGHSFTPLCSLDGCSSLAGEARGRRRRGGGGTLVSLERLNEVVNFRPPTSSSSSSSTTRSLVGSITVEGGITYTEIARFLGRKGALRNLPSCPQFTVAGAIATGTHGSGVGIRNLASQVSMIEFVVADGTLVRYHRRGDHDEEDAIGDGGGDDDDDDDDENNVLRGCRIHLGCLGVVSKLTLDVVPYYDVETVRYDDVPLERMISALPRLWTMCDSLSVWTSGFGIGHGTGTCWMTFRHFVVVRGDGDGDGDGDGNGNDDNDDVPSPSSSPPFDALVSPESSSRHVPLSDNFLGETGHVWHGPIMRYCSGADDPIDYYPTGRGPWHDALTLTLRDGIETSMTTVDLQAEFFVPLLHAQSAIRAVWNVSRTWSFSSPWGYSGSEPTKGIVDAMEFRQVKGGDGGWLSPHHVDSLGIHVSFNGDPDLRSDVCETYIPALENALRPFGARAHWGKLAPRTFQAEQIEELYGGVEEEKEKERKDKKSRLDKFRELCMVHDPSGKFRNKHINRMLFEQECG